MSTKTNKEIIFLKSRFTLSGGLEKNALLLTKAFADRNYQVKILTSADQVPNIDERIEVIPLCTPSKLSYFHLKHFDALCRDWLEKNPANIVFGLDRHSRQTHYRAGNGVHKVYLKHRKRTEGWMKRLTFRLNPLHRLILDLERKTFQSPDIRAIFTNSEMVKREIIQHYGTREDLIHPIHNGVAWKEMERDFTLWPFVKESNCMSFGLDPKQYQIVFIGNGYRRKGLPYLLKALGKIQDQPFQLSVIGKDREEGRFRALARQLKLEDKIFFFGKQEAPIKFLQIADLLAVPSVYDPFANVTVEALAMGVPVITSTNNGGYEVVTENNGSIVESVEDAGAFSMALEKAMEKPKTVLNSLEVRNNVEHLEMINQLEKIIQLTENAG